MPAHTSMLHVRVDDRIGTRAADALAGFGSTLSNAVRILLARVATEGGLPAGLVMDREAHDVWFRAKVREAMSDSGASLPHDRAMEEVQAPVDGKRRARF